MKTKTTLHVVPGGDHSLAVRGRQKDAVFEGVLDVVAAGSTRTQPRSDVVYFFTNFSSAALTESAT